MTPLSGAGGSVLDSGGVDCAVINTPAQLSGGVPMFVALLCGRKVCSPRGL
jgi:hypothetical protein